MIFDPRLLTSTRGRVLGLLRRARQTVEDLAAALDLTDNGVRVHLTALERDGLVQPHGVRRSRGKPAVLYELTPFGQELFHRAYAPVLARLIGVLQERHATDETEALLREAGRRIGREFPTPSGGTRRQRLEAAAGALNKLGGLAEVEPDADGRLHLRGYSCPIGALVHEHPAACHLAEALVAETSGLQVREKCQRDEGEPPRCCFEVAASRG
jgi:predicted ArsR family transcriptional regulator